MDREEAEWWSLAPDLNLIDAQKFLICELYMQDPLYW